jgi:hypothetical protein
MEYADTRELLVVGTYHLENWSEGREGSNFICRSVQLPVDGSDPDRISYLTSRRG